MKSYAASQSIMLLISAIIESPGASLRLAQAECSKVSSDLRKAATVHCSGHYFFKRLRCLRCLVSFVLRQLETTPNMCKCTISVPFMGLSSVQLQLHPELDTGSVTVYPHPSSTPATKAKVDSRGTR